MTVWHKYTFTGTALLLLMACSRPAAQPQPQSPADADAAATFGSTSVTLAQVDEKAMKLPAGRFEGMSLAQALYEARRMALDEIVDEALLAQEAKTRGVDAGALIAENITAKVAQPTDEDVVTFYRQNQARMNGATLDQTRPAIGAYLAQERTQAARRQYMEGLRAKANLRIALEPPREDVATADRPSKGPAQAPITMIEFADFQCPFCLAVFPALQQVLDEYGDRIRFVYRHYPLPNHPRARPAAEASACAAEQGKFWPYHDRLFSNQGMLSDADFREHAVQVGMDVAAFSACYDARKHAAEIDADVKAGDDAGVSGTPAFFINGRLLTGAQPVEAFKQIIDDELARAK